MPDWEEAEEEEQDLGPGDADWDLSEEHGYMWEPQREHWPVPPWVFVVVSIIVVIALVLPTIAVIVR